MPLELVIEDARWEPENLAAIAEPAVAAVLSHHALDEADLSILACDDPRITSLNADFRDKPKPTNVLSWPAEELAPQTPGAAPHAPSPDFDGEVALGDIAISFDTCVREAAAQSKPFDHHVSHLIVHATLHLLGYDHIRDADATRMEELERKILGTLGVPDPY